MSFAKRSGLLTIFDNIPVQKGWCEHCQSYSFISEGTPACCKSPGETKLKIVELEWEMEREQKGQTFGLVLIVILLNALVPAIWLLLSQLNESMERSSFFLRILLVYVIGYSLIKLSYKLRRSGQQAYVSELRIKHAAKPAELVLKEYNSKELPYALYLRNFAPEREQNRVPSEGWGLGRRLATASTRPLEQLILKSVDGQMPLLALSDPLDSSPMPGVHRFRSIPEDWIAFLEPIIKGASFIILYYNESTNGLLEEIRLLDELNAADKTMVIIGKKYLEQNSNGVETVPKQFSRFSEVLFERWTSRWSSTISPLVADQLQRAVKLYLTKG